MENIDLILLQSMEQGLEYGTVTLQCLKQVHNHVIISGKCNSMILLFAYVYSNIVNLNSGHCPNKFQQIPQ